MRFTSERPTKITEKKKQKKEKTPSARDVLVSQRTGKSWWVDRMYFDEMLGALLVLLAGTYFELPVVSNGCVAIGCWFGYYDSTITRQHDTAASSSVTQVLT
jgi:hypothetical protein